MVSRLAPLPILPTPRPHTQPPRLPTHLIPNCVLNLQPSQSSKWLDLSTLGNHGTVYGASPSAQGRYGFAWKFDGTDDYMDCGNDSSLFPTTAMAIELWVKTITGSFSGSANGIIHSYSGSGGYMISYNKTLDKLEFWIREDIDTYSVIRADNVITSDFEHLVGLCDTSGNMSFYINNVIQTTTYSDVTIGISTGALYIGKYATRYCQCFIDSIRLFKAALSASDINALYESGKP